MKNTMKRFFTAVISVLMLNTVTFAYGIVPPVEQGEITYDYPPHSAWQKIDNENKTITGCTVGTFIETVIVDIDNSCGCTTEFYMDGIKTTNGFIKEGMTAKIYYPNGEFVGEYTVGALEKNPLYVSVETNDLLETVDCPVYEIDKFFMSIENVRDGITVQKFSEFLNKWGNLSKAEVYYNGEEVTDGYVKNGMTVKIHDINGNYAGEFYIAPFDEVSVESIGDISPDGRIDITDITVVKGYITGNVWLTYNECKMADINQDTKIDILDVTLMRDAVVNG